MPESQNRFEILFNEKTVPVQEFHINGQTFFRILVPGQPPLVIMRANHREGYKFWTSVPEGKQELAERLGPLIERHFRTKQ
jgi:hypothetical protein